MNLQPNVNLQQKNDIILRCYEALNVIHKPLKALRTSHLPLDFLRDNNIVVSQLDWYPEDIIDFEPRFCEPYPAAAFERLFQRTRAANYWDTSTESMMEWHSECYDDEESESARRLGQSRAATWYLGSRMGFADNPLHMAARGDWLKMGTGDKLYKWRGSCWGDGSPSVWGFDHVLRSLPWPQADIPTDEKLLQKLIQKVRRRPVPDRPIAWNDALRRAGKKSLVHTAIVHVDDSEICEERLLRSELIAAIYIMRDGMRQSQCIRQHAVYPVFVYSWSAFYVRVLQVHFDFITGKLMVRKTSYIEIDGPHRQEEIKLMLRWMMNVPKGNTRWEDLDIANMGSENCPSLAGGPPSPKKPSVRCS